MCGQFSLSIEFRGGKIASSCSVCGYSSDRPNFMSNQPDVQFGSTFGLPSAYYHASDEHKETLGKVSVAISSTIFIVFMIFMCFDPKTQWQFLPFEFLFWAVVVSTVIVILSSVILQQTKLFESLNPAFDGTNYGKLFGMSVVQLLVTTAIGFLLGIWIRWLGNGILLFATLSALRVGLSNVTQILSSFCITNFNDLGSKIETLFYINTTVCAIIVCVAAYFTIPFFLQ